MRPDNDSKYKIPDRDVASWISTTFGSEVARLLNEFIVEIYAIYSVRQTINLTIGTQQYNLLDSAVCPSMIFSPHEIYIDDSMLKKYESMQSHIRNEVYDNATPWSWVETGEGLIRFNCPVEDDDVTCVCSGFSEHPTISTDSTVIATFSSRILGLFCAYAEAALRESVAADGVGLDRLSRFDQKSFQAIMRLRGTNMSRWMQREEFR
jgi:hypothetical protein